MKDAYDQIAAQYAARYATMPPVLAELGRTLLVQLPSNPVILDAGCGNGRDMAWFEAHRAQVTGIDLSPGMLAQARPHVRGPLLEMDMRSLSLLDEAFDAVWCMAAFLHLPKTVAPEALAGFRRVLKRNGFLVLGLQEGYAEGWEQSMYGNVERFFARYEPREIDELLLSAGFSTVSQARHDASMPVWLHILARVNSATPSQTHP